MKKQYKRPEQTRIRIEFRYPTAKNADDAALQRDAAAKRVRDFFVKNNLDKAFPAAPIFGWRHGPKSASVGAVAMIYDDGYDVEEFVKKIPLAAEFAEEAVDATGATTADLRVELPKFWNANFDEMVGTNE